MTVRSKRIPVIIALFSLGTVLAVLTIIQPTFLAGNRILSDFVTHEILVFLIVPLTVTFASVANIHLQVSNMVREVKRAEARQRLEQSFATPLRTEINSSAWLLFWSFVVCTIAVAVKGEFEQNPYVVSAVHSIAIVSVTITAVVLYDVHKTIFALSPVLTGKSPDTQADAIND